MVAIADQLLEVAGNEGDGLGVVQLDTTGETSLSQEAELRGDELVKLASERNELAFLGIHMVGTHVMRN